jgi:FkbM family methyltransferase
MRRLTPSVAVVHDGAWYYVSTNDDLIGRHTFSTGSYEQDLFARSLDIIEALTGSPPLRGRTLIDIGANIGTTTVPGAKVFGASLVLAFEPAPANFKLLRCNVIANDMEDRVRAYQLALSDHSGVASLEMSASNWGDHRIRAEDVRAGDGVHGESWRTTVDVPVARLDEILLRDGVDLDRLGLLWMDTQGHEGHVLAGAEAALAHGVPTVLEYWPYALARAGGLERLYRLVASHYRLVVDLRASVRANAVIQCPADRLSELEHAYPGDLYTDLILLR